jgi:dTDP-6-deoxy-L-talose 4-dehydrogenase (NAD+)
MTNLVLVTGATGFVGRQVLSALSASGARVRVVIREGSESRLAFLSAIDSIVTSKDIFSEDADWWTDVCKSVDTVIHCAWYAEPGKYLQSEKNIDCLIGTVNIAKGAVAAKVRRFIGIGTCFEYDLTPGILSIETPLRPLTTYAGAKAAAFMALSQYLPMQGMEFVWCRLFYLYGQGEDGRRLVPYLRKNLSIGQPVELTSGTQIRDFMNVVDAGRAIVKFATGRLLGPVNICSGIGISVRNLVQNIADEYGRRDLLQFGARPDNLVDPACVVGVRSDAD